MIRASKRFLGELLAVIMAVLSVFAPMNVAALTPSQMNKFAQNNILFYNPDEVECTTSATTFCYMVDGKKVCTAGLLAGNTIEERIWNLFASSNIEGVSDNPAVIAGIMGNWYKESGYNPFRIGQSDSTYSGVHMVYEDYGGTEIQNLVNSAIGRNLWAKYDNYGATYWAAVEDYTSSDVSADKILERAGVTQQEIDIALKIEFDYSNLGVVDGKEVQVREMINHFNDFVSKINMISDKNSPTAFAELYEVTVERAIPNGSDSGQPLTNSDVLKIAGSYGGYTRYQGANDRAQNAEVIYQRLKDAARPVTNNYNTGSTATGIDNGLAATSSSGFTKYEDLTDAHLLDLAEVAFSQEGGNDLAKFQEILSGMADSYEASVTDGKTDGAKLVEFVKGSDKYTSRELINGKDDDKVKPRDDFVKAARDVLVAGNRTTTAKVDTTEIVTTTSGQCKENTGPGGVEIAKRAVEYAWPVQAGQGDDAHIGMCKSSSGEWVDYNSNRSACANTAKEIYVEANNMYADSHNLTDCGRFVISVLYSLGLDDVVLKEEVRGITAPEAHDDKLPHGGASIITAYLRQAAKESDKWIEVENKGTTDNLLPGDVFTMEGHVLIYVGKYGGSYGEWAQASLNGNSPRLSFDGTPGSNGSRYEDNDYDTGGLYPYYIFRRNSSGYSGEGLTRENAEKLVKNMNNNVGNWSSIVTDALYCDSDGCPSRFANCVLVPAFFVELFAGLSGGISGGWGNADGTVQQLKRAGFETGSVPKPLSIFSEDGEPYQDENGNWVRSGHTGLVVSVDADGKVTTIEAGWKSMSPTVSGPKDPISADRHPTYAYLADKVDMDKLMEYINK